MDLNGIKDVENKYLFLCYYNYIIIFFSLHLGKSFYIVPKHFLCTWFV